jgi:hypothetical protein
MGKDKRNKLIIVILLVIVGFILWRRYKGRYEGFATQDVAEMIRNLNAASGVLGDAKSYDLWLGYLYAHSETSDEALNDMKRRFFDSSCQFRPDWATNLPPGKQRPIGATSADLANAAYQTFFKCVANQSFGCLEALADARERFMQPGCAYGQPQQIDADAKQYTPVFK